MLETPNGVWTMATVPDPESHQRQRKIVSHAFSERALREQEYILQRYSDLLISRLRDQNEEIDLCKWIHFASFDMMGELSFGESFHCLENAENHEWVSTVFKGVKVATIITALHHFPPVFMIFKWCTPTFIHEMAQRSFMFTRRAIDKRIASKSERPDFLKYMLENNYPGGMSRDEIDSTSAFLVLAGSDTTALTLSTAMYLMTKNPEVMEKLQEEVRAEFGCESREITVSSTSQLPYMHAVLQEAMRIHTPGSVSVPREVNRPDVKICGMPVPQGVSYCLQFNMS